MRTGLPGHDCIISRPPHRPEYTSASSSNIAKRRDAAGPDRSGRPSEFHLSTLAFRPWPSPAAASTGDSALGYEPFRGSEVSHENRYRGARPCFWQESCSDHRGFQAPERRRASTLAVGRLSPQGREHTANYFELLETKARQHTRTYADFRSIGGPGSFRDCQPILPAAHDG